MLGVRDHGVKRGRAWATGNLDGGIVRPVEPFVFPVITVASLIAIVLANRWLLRLPVSKGLVSPGFGLVAFAEAAAVIGWAGDDPQRLTVLLTVMVAIVPFIVVQLVQHRGPRRASVMEGRTGPSSCRRWRSGSEIATPPSVGRRPLRRVARPAEHNLGVADVERRTASERDDVVDRQITRPMGGTLVPRAPVPALATPGPGAHGRGDVARSCPVQGVVCRPWLDCRACSGRRLPGRLVMAPQTVHSFTRESSAG